MRISPLSFRSLIRSSDFKIFEFIFISFLFWKIAITLIAFFGLSFLPIHLPENQIGIADSKTEFWIRWANWDGGHFRGIAENHYLHSFQVVFFPLYPILIKGLMLLRIPSLWGGIIISNLAIIGTLYYLYKLVRLDFDEKIAKKTIFTTLAFPTAFYFNAVYSESLFLFFTIASLYFARNKNWLVALIFGSLSAVTRLAGLIVIFSVCLEYFLKTNRLPSIKEYWSEFLNRIATYVFAMAFLFSVTQKFFADNKFFMLSGLSESIAIFLSILFLLLISVFGFKFLYKNFEFKKIMALETLLVVLSFAPFLIYCLFLYDTQGSFFAFINHEKQWERHLTLPWTAPINYFKDLLNIGFFQVGHSAQRLIEFLFFVLISVTLIFSYLKLRLSYIIYFAFSLLLPISTGTLQAIHRYALVIFPIFIVLALIKNETYYQLWMYFSLTLLGLLTVLFINGYWVT